MLDVAIAAVDVTVSVEVEAETIEVDCSFREVVSYMDMVSTYLFSIGIFEFYFCLTYVLKYDSDPYGN